MEAATAAAAAGRPAAGASRQIDELGGTVHQEFKQFLASYHETDGRGEAHYVYREQLRALVRNEKYTLYVSYAHLLRFHQQLADTVEEEYYRFEPFLRAAAGEFAKEHEERFSGEAAENLELCVAFYDFPIVNKIRTLKTDKVGRLASITGTVVRTSEVRPELVRGTFICLECQTVNADVEQQFKYTEPLICRNPVCENRLSFHLDTDRSKFVDWQRARIQESSDEIPSGSMPRSVDVILRHETVELAKPGDKIRFTGTLIAVPDVGQLTDGKVSMSGSAVRSRDGYTPDGVTGLRALGVRDLTYKLAFLACTVQPADARDAATNIRDESTAESIVEEMTEEEREDVLRMRDDPRLYENMATSIAPTVFGHEEIKRGVLLMLLGGVHKTTIEGISLRGDVNVCIVGDPSTAKSQFLKYVVRFLPRAVYASGKSSSAAGLTVSVAKDEETNEFCIEAGALMLADNGICCIDEFDKMDPRDQVAIHEAMEQQTISIAKAGIQATLNARTSILAAANPVGGRYDKSKTLRANVAMSPAIMSRFDLFFIVVDECNDVSDYNIARYLVNIHQQLDSAVAPPYTTAQLQRYIRFARTLKPAIPEESRTALARLYRQLRQGDAGVSKSSYRITVRQLESMVRLSEALARLHCDEEVKPAYVDEAFRLIRKSIIHVESEDVSMDDGAAAAAVAAAEAEEQAVPVGEESSQQPTPTPPPPAGPRSSKMRRADGAPPAPPAPTTATAAAAAVPPAAPRPTTISYDKYRRIANMMVRHLSRAADDVEDRGMRRSKLVEWYLEEVADELLSEGDLLKERDIAFKVIRRLVHTDRILFELSRDSQESLEMETEETVPSAGSAEDPIVVVNPNYVPD